MDEPGQIRHVGGPASLTFGEWDNAQTERVRGLRSICQQAGIAAPTPEDIWAELWSKFLFVVPFGTLGSASNAPIGVLRSRRDCRQLLEAVMREIEALATASGVRLPSDIVETSLAFIDQQPEAGRSSLQRDLHVGRPTELEAWTGAVVRLAERRSVPTPVHSVLYPILRVLQSQAGGAPE